MDFVASTLLVLVVAEIKNKEKLMSYEGYSQYLCRNGHKTIIDSLEELPKHCDCGKEFIFSWQVNQTNGDELHNALTMEYPFDVLEERKYVTCKSCGSLVETKEPRFKVPTYKEMNLHIERVREEGPYWRRKNQQ